MHVSVLAREVDRAERRKNSFATQFPGRMKKCASESHFLQNGSPTFFVDQANGRDKLVAPMERMQNAVFFHCADISIPQVTKSHVGELGLPQRMLTRIP
jgi:hypothetical protein